LVQASPAEVALTHNTTDGMNIIVHGLAWQAGDEVVTTKLEHPGGLLPLYVNRQRYGVVVKVVDIPADLSAEEVVARLEAAMTPRTRLLALSHVAWNTGMRLPLADIVAMAHRHNALCLIDGAQSGGAIALNLPASGVDFYAITGQKWLCGPEGIGALYLRQEHLNLVAPTFVGYRSMDRVGGHDWTGYFMPQPDARRYEVGTTYRPGVSGMLANLTWLEEVVGWDWIHAHITQLSEYAHQALAATPGITVLSPGQSGLVVFELERYDPDRVVTKLAEDDIILRSIHEPHALRISTGFYNTEKDVDRLIVALQAIQKIDPELLPQPAW
jgi:L-cysteine/cystine lyase